MDARYATIPPDAADASSPRAAPSRYDGLSQLLHWTTAAALFLLLPFVWVAENFPPGAKCHTLADVTVPPGRGRMSARVQPGSSADNPPHVSYRNCDTEPSA